MMVTSQTTYRCSECKKRFLWFQEAIDCEQIHKIDAAVERSRKRISSDVMANAKEAYDIYNTGQCAECGESKPYLSPNTDNCRECDAKLAPPAKKAFERFVDMLTIKARKQ